MRQKEVVTDVKIVRDFLAMNGAIHVLVVVVHGHVMIYPSVQDVVDSIELDLPHHLQYLPVKVPSYKKIIQCQPYLRHRRIYLPIINQHHHRNLRCH